MTREELDQSNQINILGAGKVTKNRHSIHNNNIANYVDDSFEALAADSDFISTVTDAVVQSPEIVETIDSANEAAGLANTATIGANAAALSANNAAANIPSTQTIVEEVLNSDTIKGLNTFQINGKSSGLPRTENLIYFDTLRRASTVNVAAGNKIGIFDNSTSYGAVFVTGAYQLDVNGLTKTSTTNSSVLMLPDSMSGDIDMEICVRSIFLLNPTPNFPPDSGLGILLRVQDEQNYCIIQVNNQHTLGCSLTIREALNGVETVRGSYANIYVSETAPKMSNTWPTLRVVLRGDRVTVSLNGIRVISNISLQNVKYGRHGLRIYKTGTLIKDFKIRENKSISYPAFQVEKRQLLYGDGNRYVGWADCASLPDGSVFVVWRESTFDTPSGGHEVAGSIMCAKWANGILGESNVLYAAEGETVNDLQEQDCVLSKVFYNGRDQLVLFTRKYRKIGGLNTTYVSTCDIGLNNPTDPTKWSSRTAVSFPSQISITAPHAKVIMDSSNTGFITAFYGTRVGSSLGAIIVASSVDMVTWTFRSFAIDPIASVNPVPGGDFEPVIVRGAGASILLYGRARTVISHDDGLTWCQYDLLGGNSNRTRAFGSSITTEQGVILMHRRYTNQTTPADTVLIPLQANDGFFYQSADFLSGAVIEQQFNGMDLPGKANPGGDSGCPRVACIGDGKYLLLNYMQEIDEMAPRLYQYILTTK